MATLTYTKGLPTPAEEQNALGFTLFEMFLTAYAPMYRAAVCETVNHLLACEQFNKSAWNTYLQRNYSINKRHANGVISDAKGQVDSTKECRQNHIKQLEGKLKSAQKWLKKAEKKLKDARKFYAKKYPQGKTWRDSKSGCRFPMSSSLVTRNTNWQQLRFNIHHKKRRIAHLERQILSVKSAPIRVKVPHNQCFVVGSKSETLGNQVCQWDGEFVKFRVPAGLEDRFGKYVSTRLGGYDRGINRLPVEGAKTWHFYRKHRKWNAAVQLFTPAKVERVSRQAAYGCIGIDMNPGSIGWAYVDYQGNLKHHGKIALQMGLPKAQQQQQIVEACLQLAIRAETFACPVVCEDLDFAKKKEQLKEKGAKSARMLSGWAYAKFQKLLQAILANRGISVMKVNPAYTSQIALVKYLRMYGISSDVAAGVVVARRSMKLSKRLPNSMSALDGMNPAKHVWSAWNKVKKTIKSHGLSRRHDYYTVSNWGLVAKGKSEEASMTDFQALTKLQGTSSRANLHRGVGFG